MSISFLIIYKILPRLLSLSQLGEPVILPESVSGVDPSIPEVCSHQEIRALARGGQDLVQFRDHLSLLVLR